MLLRRFLNLTVKLRLGNMSSQISEIEEAKPGFDPGLLAPQTKSLTNPPLPLPISLEAKNGKQLCIYHYPFGLHEDIICSYSLV